ncbi:surface carbohydrate biosynthesis protein [Halobacillus sp. Marseille-Q1614]|uniref:surface carbohydrate biosynthesis protein n=1 Tax=Halobacillus sp. Marseille-Q1614 TaxID=2709134 RepID=UPI00156D90B2|nr:surface carbohydrate biosynthesis protein [Halobacillus sp. Marseille-Q1614]
MAKKTWLYLPIEGKARELEAKMLLAYYAIQENYCVVLGEHRMVEAAAAELPGGLFFLKGYPHSPRKKVMERAVTHGHCVVELDEEGLVFSDPSPYLNQRMKGDLFTFLTHEYCWGPYQKEIITKAYPQHASKCHMVGNPRFDLLRPKYRPLYQNEAKDIQAEYGDFILINTRFPLYNGSQRKKEGESHPSLLYIKQLYYQFIEMAKFLSLRFPETSIVLRPHPAENVASYQKALASYKNVSILHEGSVIQWLLAAKLVVHNGCTSSIEAFLLEKPIISYVPSLSSPAPALLLPDKLGIMATKVEEVESLARQILEENDFSFSVQGARSLLDRYYTGDEYSFTSILRLMKELPVPQEEFSGSPQIKYKAKSSKKLEHLFPSLLKKEILHFFEKLDAIEGKNKVYNVTSLGMNLYLIEDSGC